jgi:hypothetical protein
MKEVDHHPREWDRLKPALGTPQEADSNIVESQMIVRHKMPIQSNSFRKQW